MLLACRISFQLTEYIHRQRLKHGAFFAEQPFYPEASVTFQITPQQTKEHFHIPLTWSPYGYSTYRGSLTQAARLLRNIVYIGRCELRSSQAKQMVWNSNKELVLGKVPVSADLLLNQH